MSLLCRSVPSLVSPCKPSRIPGWRQSAALSGLAWVLTGCFAFSQATERIAVQLVQAPPIEFPSPSDSNSPAFWQGAGGKEVLTVVNSVYTSSLSSGRTVDALGHLGSVTFTSRSGKAGKNGGRWIESVIQAPSGKLYGFYHNEPSKVCSDKTAPRIGAAHSMDGGATWLDLGIILEPAKGGNNCSTPNKYFVGGFGDFTAVWSPDREYIYFFFSAYSGDVAGQGVAAARMRWVDRDSPQGKLAVWSHGLWTPYRNGNAASTERTQITPIYAASVSWHDPSGRVDAFWGPSVHWNTRLKRYVMLLNRASDSLWSQDGIYIAFSPVLDDPTRWTAPVRILQGGGWYPQVIGLEPGEGTDKLAGTLARLFVAGHSEYWIGFSDAPADPADRLELTINADYFCIGESWHLDLTGAAPNAPVRLLGASNGVSWEIDHWGTTDAAGGFVSSGKITAEGRGVHALGLEVAGILSNVSTFFVEICGP